jgi:hypothetical protein
MKQELSHIIREFVKPKKSKWTVKLREAARLNEVYPSRKLSPYYIQAFREGDRYLRFYLKPIIREMRKLESVIFTRQLREGYERGSKLHEALCRYYDVLTLEDQTIQRLLEANYSGNDLKNIAAEWQLKGKNVTKVADAIGAAGGKFKGKLRVTADNVNRQGDWSMYGLDDEGNVAEGGGEQAAPQGDANVEASASNANAEAGASDANAAQENEAKPAAEGQAEAKPEAEASPAPEAKPAEEAPTVAEGNGEQQTEASAGGEQQSPSSGEQQAAQEQDNTEQQLTNDQQVSDQQAQNSEQPVEQQKATVGGAVKQFGTAMKAAVGNAVGGVAQKYHNWRANANAKKAAKAQGKVDKHQAASTAAGTPTNLSGQKIQQSRRQLTSSESERRLFETIWRNQ